MSAEVPHVEAAGAAEFRAWLRDHHDTAQAAWLVLWKKRSGHRSIELGEAIDQALCFGWVDSKSQSIDDDRYRVYFSVRKAGSVWSSVNKEKITRLTAEGAMAPAGTTAVERAKADGSWTILDGPEAGVVPNDLAGAMEAAAVRDAYEALTFGAKKAILTWLVMAKRRQTRNARIDKTVAALREGRSPLP